MKKNCFFIMAIAAVCMAANVEATPTDTLSVQPRKVKPSYCQSSEKSTQEVTIMLPDHKNQESKDHSSLD